MVNFPIYTPKTNSNSLFLIIFLPTFLLIFSFTFVIKTKSVPSSILVEVWIELLWYFKASKITTSILKSSWVKV